MNPDLFLTTTLREAPWGAAVTRVLAAAVAAVDPAVAVRRHLRRDGDALHAGTHVYELGHHERVFIVGAGKAGAPMAQAAAEILGDRLTGGVVVVKEGHGGRAATEGHGGRAATEGHGGRAATEGHGGRAATEGHGGRAATEGLPYRFSILNSQFSILDIIEAGHPLPDERGIAGARRMVELLAGVTERDLVIALISGGGSALLTLPVAGVGLAELQSLTTTLLRCGAEIGEINTLRKHLDQLKGGGLARLAHPAPLLTLILSDVIGNPLDVIGSGPTVPDPTTFADAYAVLERYGVVDAVPASILEHLRRGRAGAVPETPKPGDERFAQVCNVLIGSNEQAAEAARAAAEAEGFRAIVLTSALKGEARLAGAAIGEIVARLAAVSRPLDAPLCLIWGGETTVTLRGSGRGGRNQELALAAVAPLAGTPQVALVALATDGGDGPTDAAGAVVSGATLERARRLGLDPAAYLDRNNAYPFFAALGDLLRPGPTRTNVNDLAFVFLF